MYKKVIDQNHEQWKLQPDTRLDIIDGSNYPVLYSVYDSVIYRRRDNNFFYTEIMVEIKQNNNINKCTEYGNEQNLTKYDFKYVYYNHSRCSR